MYIADIAETFIYYIELHLKESDCIDLTVVANHLSLTLLSLKQLRFISW